MKNTKIQFFTRSRKVAQGSSRNTNDFFDFFFSKFLRGELWEALLLYEAPSHPRFWLPALGSPNGFPFLIALPRRECVKIAFIPVPLKLG